MNDVDLKYSQADYQNLTTFSLFMRMVRPQIVAVSSRSISTRGIFCAVFGLRIFCKKTYLGATQSHKRMKVICECSTCDLC